MVSDPSGQQCEVEYIPTPTPYPLILVPFKEHSFGSNLNPYQSYQIYT